MNDQILNLTKKLIEVPSIKGNSDSLKKVLAVACENLQEFTIETFSKNDEPSVLVYSGKVRPKRFKIILNAHLDVVPAKEEQYKPIIKDNLLYARGSNDMKAAAAVEILVFKELAQTLPYPTALQLVTDEETGGFNGVKYQVEQGVRADFVIAGEPTDFGINNKAKGIIWAKITTQGASAHGAYPWQGKNAILEMSKVLNQLEKEFPVPKKEVWKTTVNVAKIETTNQTFNKVPDECTVSLDIRYIPEDEKTVVKKLEKIASTNKLEILLKEPSQFSDEANEYIQKLRKVTKNVLGKTSKTIVKHGGSDIRHFNSLGCDGVTFGPIGAGLHTDNEWVDINSLTQYYHILSQFLTMW